MYEKQWVLRLLDEVLIRLREEYRARGNTKHFTVLKEFISGVPDDQTYKDASEQLRISENAAKVAASRLRKRYRELLRQEVARTVAEPGEVEDEIKFLFSALG
jgi:RNA polymerase sigma-70 factor (ECF subfamily)